MANEEALESMRLAGSTLGPLFLHDPLLDEEAIGPLYEILAQSDPAVLAAEWPFVDEGEALPLLADLVEGAAAHVVARDEAAKAEAADDGASDAIAQDGKAEVAARSVADDVVARTPGASHFTASPAPDTLTAEYRRLFVGPAPKAAPPWGSVYTDKDQVVFGASTLELRDWLRRNGIAVNRTDDSDEPEDHIGTMLVLLAWLADEKPPAVEEYLRDHLLPWAPHFLELMEGAADLPFFQSLAALTRLTLTGAQEQLGLEVETPRFYR